jgi:hypothetical protein
MATTFALAHDPGSSKLDPYTSNPHPARNLSYAQSLDIRKLLIAKRGQVGQGV